LPFCKRFDFFAAGFDVDFLVGMFLPLFESACFVHSLKCKWPTKPGGKLFSVQSLQIE